MARANLKKVKFVDGVIEIAIDISIAISMTIQRGNATSIMGTLGPLRTLEDLFDVISPREEES